MCVEYGVRIRTASTLGYDLIRSENHEDDVPDLVCTTYTQDLSRSNVSDFENYLLFAV
jgi:hypothetical protein